MGKSKEVQLIPSGGVLIVALIAAILAAILVNVYISGVKSGYTTGSKTLVQVTKDIPLGTVVNDADLKEVVVPPQLLKDGLFATAVERKDALTEIVKKPAPRNYWKGEFLFYGDTNPAIGRGIFQPSKGHQMADIPVATSGRLIQSGTYVSISGDFNIDPDPKKQSIKFLTVIPCVKIAYIDGDVSGAVAKGKTVESIQFVVKDELVKKLDDLKSKLVSRKFTIHTTALPEPPDAEPMLAKEADDFLKTQRGLAEVPTLTLPGTP
jgi:hypothetical protein